MLTCASFASTSEVQTPAVLEWLKYGVEVTFGGTTSRLDFIKIYYEVQTLLGGTHRRIGW
jgi:hypothetical protein